MIRYFKNKKWDEITREERFFCSQLFEEVKEQSNLKKFIHFLNNCNSEVPNFTNKLNINPNKYWELAFEVCFYRDILKHYNYKIREAKEKFNIPLPEKRTFDLCLFSSREIIIIEVKAQQGLSRTQNSHFEEDIKSIENLFNKILEMKPPSVYLVVLASSKYYSSNSFIRKDGVGKEIADTHINNKRLVDAFISWDQIYNKLSKRKIYKQADESFKN